MAWAAKSPANEPLTGLLTDLLTARMDFEPAGLYFWYELPGWLRLLS